MAWRFLVKVLLILLQTFLFESQNANDVCVNGSNWNDLTGMDPDEYVNYETESRHYAFLVFDRPIDCYGKIQAFEFNHSDACHDLQFQVYRPQGESSDPQYILVGNYYFPFTTMLNTTCGDEGFVRIDVPREFQIPVQPYDRIAWLDVDAPPNSLLPTNLPPNNLPPNMLPPNNLPPNNLPPNMLPPNTLPPNMLPPMSDRLFLFDEGNSGSTQFDVVHILPEHNACMAVGGFCPWQSTFVNTTVVSRSYTVDAILMTGDKPLIDSLPSEAQVAEHKPPGEFVFQVVASNNRNYNPVIPVNLTFQIMNITDPSGIDVFNENVFSINSTTGVVITEKELDHEDIEIGQQSFYELAIRVQQGDSGPYSDDFLTVNVIDVNEPHYISNLPTTVTIDSATIVNGGFVYDVNHEELPDLSFSPNSRDDENSWPRKSYTMVNSDMAVDVFKIDPDGVVSLRKDISMWRGTNITQLYITCTDGYYTTTPKILTVVIGNLWLPPYLENLPNTVSVPETTTEDLDLYDVTSFGDSRSTRSYEILAVYPPVVNPPVGTNPFFISAGDVMIQNAEFNYRQIQKYEVEIAVFDVLYDSSEVKAENLTVEITMVNTVPFWKDSDYDGWIDELSTIGSTVYGIDIKADDRDIPFGDYISYIIDGDGSHLFYASNITHKVYMAQEYELDCGTATKTYNLTLTVLDAAGASSETSLTIRVHDINNNIPQLDAPYYSGQVSENWIGRTHVQDITVKATDCDGDKYGRVDIVVFEDYARIYFEIEPVDWSGFPTPVTKKLVLKQPISYTDYPNITFTLIVSDRGDPRLNSTASVFVEVIDVNDHPPEFVSDFYDHEEMHDVSTGSTVVRVVSTDLDSEINSNVTYFLLIPDDHFTIDGATGEVTNFKELEAYEKYILYVYARDYANPEELYSDPSIVRIDTYPAQKHLVDIHMQLPLDDFKSIVDDFLQELNSKIAPWFAKQEYTLLNRDKSILTIYALTEVPPTTRDQHYYDKHFVHVDDLLDALRVNIQGQPKDWLRSNDFSEYQIYKVVPTYPYWLVDTIGGIVTLTLLCLLFLLLILLVFWLIYGRSEDGCSTICKKNKVTPAPPKSEPPGYETPMFDMKYAEYNHARNFKPEPGPFVTSTSKRPFPHSSKNRPTHKWQEMELEEINGTSQAEPWG